MLLLWLLSLINVVKANSLFRKDEEQTIVSFKEYLFSYVIGSTASFVAACFVMIW